MASNTSNTDVFISPIVTIPYDDLHSEEESVLTKIGQGFGVDGYGIIAITNIPNYTGLRGRLLHLGRQLATETPQKILDELTIPESYYTTGWSHGKEKVEGDKFDTGKGSFYANPMTDDVVNDVLQRDFEGQNEQGQDQQSDMKKEEFMKVAKENPAFYHPNVWPDETLPCLKHTLKEMGMLIRSIGKLVGQRCDAYVLSQCDGYAGNKMESIIDSSLCAKARLLHYFPSPSDEDDSDNQEEDPKVTSDKGKEETTKDDVNYSTWCGWHNDHCSMTGLVPAMYMNAKGEEVTCPDPDAGLYIKSRKGELIHVNVPPDALAFQIGETAQIHTGGVLQATPHAVRGCCPKNAACKGISRESFAVFMQPEYFGDMAIPSGRTIKDAQKRDAENHLPRTVRNLRSRWSPGINFGEFSQNTFEAFS